MKKRPSPLTLHRETLRLLEERTLRKTPAGFVAVVNDTDQPECFSPLCGPTYWKGCETN
ncbi:MAG TPA: hypothetical protein VH988_12860 [Thermoanaerobaculia bacterium]|nr:hypothetical protein [Thermoanaerobaculia bacterium]